MNARVPGGHELTAVVVAKLDDRFIKATGSSELLVEIPGAQGGIRVGSRLNASIESEGSEAAVTIPKEALLKCSQGHFVYAVSGEHFVRTPVKVGAINEKIVEIKDGPYAGDQVVVQPVMSLWMTELAAVKGGQACCVEPPKGK